jgi:hypothetical protein
LLNGEAPETAAIQGILTRLEAEGLTETALAMLRKQRSRFNMHHAPPWCALRIGLEATAEKARRLRLRQGQLDPGRRTVRICFEVRSPASELNPSALLHNLVRVLLEAGLPVAMGLEKAPRPMVTLGPPLPLAAEGLAEWADCVLREPSALPVEEWPSRLTAHCPPGLKLLHARLVPNHSSAILELARQARWRWNCPEDLRDLARPRLEAFRRASSFEIEKTGKVDGHKGLKRIEVRAFVLDMAWAEDTLLFSTWLQPGMAPSPLKLLAGILGVDSTRIKGLSRLEVLLAEDARLAEANKYEPKLHNIYEDAVLLESDGPVRRIEEDDDELLLER